MAKKLSSFRKQRKNANRHTERGMELLEQSMAESGWIGAITVAADGETFDGSARLEVANECFNGAEPIIVETDGSRPVVLMRTDIPNADDPAAKKLAIAANRIAEIDLSWDPEILAELNDEIDLSGLFEESELNELLAQPDSFLQEESEEEVAELAEKAESGAIELRCNSGELWKLGSHRLMIGNSTDLTSVKKLMAGDRAAMAWTDPPYNVDYDPEARKSSFSEDRTSNPLGKIANDKMSDQDFRAFLDGAYKCMNEALIEGGAIYISHADLMGHHFRNAFIAQPWKLQSCLIWKKSVLCFGRADYHWMHEPILYGWKEGASHNYYGDRKQTTILEFKSAHYNKEGCDTEGYVHPTQKPTDLIEYCIENSSKPGDIVLDLFGGSGSTLIACQKTGRHARLSELDPRFGTAIIERFEKLTGVNAELVGSV